MRESVNSRAPVCGLLWVKCDDCGMTWKETSRDILSPSHVDCPNHCDHGGDTHVWKTERADLPRDRSGNLRKHECEVLTAGLTPDQEQLAEEIAGYLWESSTLRHGLFTPPEFNRLVSERVRQYFHEQNEKNPDLVP